MLENIVVTHLHAVELDRRRRSRGVGKGGGAQQLYYYVGCWSMWRRREGVGELRDEFVAKLVKGQLHWE